MDMAMWRVRRGTSFGLYVWLCCLWLLPAVASAAAPPAPDDLTQALSRIFTSSDLNSRSFGPAEWVDDGAAYLTLEASEATSASATSATTDLKDIVRYDTATGKREVLVSAATLLPSGAAAPLRIERYAFSADKTRVLVYTNSKKVWRQNTRGDYWVVDRGAKSLRKLGGDAPESTLMFAKFSPDGRRVAYVREHNLYVEDVATGAITPLTTDGSATIINGTSDWVYEEEFDLRDGFRWSPDSARLAYWRLDSTGVGAFPIVNNAAGIYPSVTVIPYPKAGTTNSAATVGIVSSSGGPTTWIKVPDDPRESYVARMDWVEGHANELVLQHLNRLQNRNDVLLADARTGDVRTLFTDRDDAWVDVVDDFTWLKQAQTPGANLLWLSERDGWRRLYAASHDDGRFVPVSGAGADVMEVVATDAASEWVYYTAAASAGGSRPWATQRVLFRARADGRGTPQRLTPDTASGVHGYRISPDGRWAFHISSTFDQPPVTELIRLPSHQTVRVLEDNHALKEHAAPLLAAPSEFFTLDIGDGVTLDGWMLRPPDFDPARKYPVLVYVYGEPAGATVTDGWGGKRGLFHRALARDGFIVVSFDNRGTPAPKGRAWRKVVYGEVGVLSAKEQAAAIRAFAGTRPYVDTSRMAIWGWSGGGSNALNLMFRSPGLFQVGVSVAPVPDQRLYDTIYQERYMGLPQQNADGYRAGSPINFADGLQGRLLIIHGSGDDNCHIQGTELLVNRLISLSKPFDYFVYPGRTHSIDEGAGTSFHLHTLIARYIKEHLPAAASTGQ
jgi:dipeptidyl-peptidase-4